MQQNSGQASVGQSQAIGRFLIREGSSQTPPPQAKQVVRVGAPEVEQLSPWCVAVDHGPLDSAWYAVADTNSAWRTADKRNITKGPR